MTVSLTNARIAATAMLALGFACVICPASDAAPKPTSDPWSEYELDRADPFVFALFPGYDHATGEVAARVVPRILALCNVPKIRSGDMQLDETNMTRYWEFREHYTIGGSEWNYSILMSRHMNSGAARIFAVHEGRRPAGAVTLPREHLKPFFPGERWEGNTIGSISRSYLTTNHIVSGVEASPGNGSMVRDILPETRHGCGVRFVRGNLQFAVEAWSERADDGGATARNAARRLVRTHIVPVLPDEGKVEAARDAARRLAHALDQYFVRCPLGGLDETVVEKRKTLTVMLDAGAEIAAQTEHSLKVPLGDARVAPFEVRIRVDRGEVRQSRWGDLTIRFAEAGFHTISCYHIDSSGECTAWGELHVEVVEPPVQLE